MYGHVIMREMKVINVYQIAMTDDSCLHDDVEMMYAPLDTLVATEQVTDTQRGYLYTLTDRANKIILGSTSVITTVS